MAWIKINFKSRDKSRKAFKIYIKLFYSIILRDYVVLFKKYFKIIKF